MGAATRLPYHINAVGAALDLLALFSPDVPEWRISDLSRTTGISKNKVFRILQTLGSRGFVEQNRHTRGYRLGGRVMELAHAFAHGSDLRQEAWPVMRRMTTQSEESSFLCVLDGMSSLCVECVESSQSIRLSAVIGRRQPLYCSVTGKVLLAARRDEWIRAYLRRTPLRAFTPRTITDPGRLRRQIKQVRAHGYAVNIGERDQGAAAIAAPVRDAGGQVVAGLALGGPADRILARRRRLVDLVAAGAAEISRRLGYAPPEAPARRAAAGRSVR